MDIFECVTQEIKKRFIHNKFEWKKIDFPNSEFDIYALYIDNKETFIRIDYESLKHEFKKIDGYEFTKDFVRVIINPLIEDMFELWNKESNYYG